MSFVEKNKAWLLPLLGVGVAAVVYVNYRDMTAPAPVAPAGPAAPAAPASEGQGPAAAPAVAVAPRPTTAASVDAQGLWADLQALAAPPAALAQESALRERARASLGPLLDVTFPTGLPRPARVREAAPAHAAAAVAAALVPREAPAVPSVEFILSGPAGFSAWFQGRPYRLGQTLRGGGFRVEAITWNRVTLSGPAGQVIQRSTSDFNRPAAGSRPSVEGS